MIGWKEAKIMEREQNKKRRLIKEAIWIRKKGPKTLNRDDGNFPLPHIYDQLITAPPTTSTSIRKKSLCGSGQSI